MGDLERVLPNELRERTLWPGDELVLPHAEALKTLEIASDNHIAVLGLEAFKVQEDGLLTVDYTDYDSKIRFAGTGLVYASVMNVEAGHWLRDHPYGKDHGYILTSASESEFAACMIKFGSLQQLADPAIAELVRRFRTTTES